MLWTKGGFPEGDTEGGSDPESRVPVSHPISSFYTMCSPPPIRLYGQEGSVCHFRVPPRYVSVPLPHRPSLGPLPPSCGVETTYGLSDPFLNRSRESENRGLVSLPPKHM